MAERPFDRTVAGKAYKPDAECMDIYRRAAQLCRRYTELYFAGSEERHEVLQELFGSVGKNVEVRPNIQVDYGVNITVGDGCFFNFDTVILDVAPVTFGNFVLVGPCVQFLTPTHPLNPQDRKDLWEGGLPITVEDNVWIGGGATILPGVRIGENSVIGGGAIVTKDIPANSVAVGNPARVIRTLSPDERPASGQFSATDLGIAL